MQDFYEKILPYVGYNVARVFDEISTFLTWNRKLRSSMITRGNSMKTFLLVLKRVSDQISPAVNGISTKKPSPKVYSKRTM